MNPEHTVVAVEPYVSKNTGDVVFRIDCSCGVVAVIEVSNSALPLVRDTDLMDALAEVHSSPPAIFVTGPLTDRLVDYSLRHHHTLECLISAAKSGEAVCHPRCEASRKHALFGDLQMPSRIAYDAAMTEAVRQALEGASRNVLAGLN